MEAGGFKFIKKEELDLLPRATGVYSFWKKNKVLYIGKSNNLYERVKSHFRAPSFKDNIFVDSVDRIGYSMTLSEVEALLLESRLIKKFAPKYNVLWKDDKNYFFVGITKEEFPRIFITHQKKLKGDKKALFLGPFIDGKALKKTLQLMRRIFPFRSCTKLPKKACLWYYLKRCPGPCLFAGRKNEMEYRLIRREVRKNTKYFLDFFKGGRASVRKALEREMMRLANEEKFEEAKKIRDQIYFLERVLDNFRILEKEEVIDWENLKEDLRKILKLKRKISRIEAFDISNIQGQYGTGSMVVFINGTPEKSFYRRFKIKFHKKPNDVGMLKEVLKRRFQHSEWGLPDLIFIDGGKSQLNAGIQVKKEFKFLENVKVISLAKKQNQLFIEGEIRPIELNRMPRQIFHLILQIRDEAHRFALSYYRKRHSMGLFKDQDI